MTDTDDNLPAHDFNHRVETIDGQPYLFIDLMDSVMVFTPENWLAFVQAGSDAIAFGLKQNAPAPKRMQ